MPRNMTERGRRRRRKRKRRKKRKRRRSSADDVLRERTLNIVSLRRITKYGNLNEIAP